MYKWTIILLFSLALFGCVDPKDREAQASWDRLEEKLIAVGERTDTKLIDIFDTEHTESEFLGAFPLGTRKIEIKERLEKALGIEGVTIHDEAMDELGFTLLSIQMSVDQNSLLYFVSFTINETGELTDIGSGFGGFGTVGDY